MIDKIISFIVKDNGMELISAFIGLLGVYWTIQYTRNQFNDDKRMGIKPYLDLSLRSQYCSTEFTPDYEEDIYEEDNHCYRYINSDTYYAHLKDTFSHREGSLSLFYVELDLENIGLGHAIDYKLIDIYGENIKTKIKENISIIRKDDKSKIFIEISKMLKKEYLTFLDISINCEEEKARIEEKFWHGNEDFPNDYTVIDKLKKQSREEIYIDVEYKDMLNNKYKKTFCLELLFYIDEGILAEKDIIKGRCRVLRNKYNEKLIKRKRRGKICNS